MRIAISQSTVVLCDIGMDAIMPVHSKSLACYVCMCVCMCVWCVCGTTEVAQLYLEDHESPLHLSSLLATLPTVSDLVARLKPKLISDPLLHPATSKPHTYMQVCRCV